MAFKDIIGQEVPKKLLQTQLKTDKIGTSYLFYGTEGVGKTLTAKTFAKAINCENNKLFTPWGSGVFKGEGVSPLPLIVDACDVCQTCRGIEKNPDFVLIEPTSTKSIGIDQIRAIKSNTSYRTTFLKVRVIIIRAADTLTEEAANAFLKLLEEAPQRSIFILTTAKIEAIIPTVKSRCQQIKFRKLRTDEIKKLLPTAPEWILQLANGSVTRAIKLMEPETKEIRDMGIQFFESDAHQRIQLIPKLVEKLDPRTKDTSHNIEDFLWLIQELYMDLMRKKLGTIIKNSTFEFKKELQTLEILSAITALEKAFYATEHNVHKRLILYWLAEELP